MNLVQKSSGLAVGLLAMVVVSCGAAATTTPIHAPVSESNAPDVNETVLEVVSPGPPAPPVEQQPSTEVSGPAISTSPVPVVPAPDGEEAIAEPASLTVNLGTHLQPLIRLELNVTFEKGLTGQDILDMLGEDPRYGDFIIIGVTGTPKTLELRVDEEPLKTESLNQTISRAPVPVVELVSLFDGVPLVIPLSPGLQPLADGNDHIVVAFKETQIPGSVASDLAIVADRSIGSYDCC